MLQSILPSNADRISYTRSRLPSRTVMRHQPMSSYLSFRSEPHHPYKIYKNKFKSPSHNAFAEMMSLFQTKNQHLIPPTAPSRKRSQHLAQRDLDEFLSSDLEVSFASTVSLNSPPKDNVPLTPDRDYAEPMDISPLPQSKSYANAEARKSASRPRAYTSSARLFGNDLSNNTATHSQVSQKMVVAPSYSSNAADTSTQGGKRTQRSALPTEWLMNSHVPESKPEPALVPSSPADDAMDVDSSFSMAPEAVAPLSFSPIPKTAHSTSNGFNALFHNTLSPRRSFESPQSHQKKRRSVSPEPTLRTEQDLSSPGFSPSPSDAKVDRNGKGKPTLQGLGAPSLFARRNRRPVLSAAVQPLNIPHANLPSPDQPDPRGGLPVRRAFSALLPPSFASDQYSEEPSFEGPDGSSPAQAYAKRQQGRTLRRCDGSESLRSVSDATVTGPIPRESPGRFVSSPMSKYLAPGLGGFGDNEAHGKILPCHKVTEDGLMRIQPETLNALIDGEYDSQIHDYHIIDCRFDYEYIGGHIPGAVNINTTMAVEELLLGPSLTKPKPSISGDPTRKTILVFHCEFSAKRAPTFAKHLRAKDRAANNMVYPKIHYPEIYILEGGYCAYFKASGHRCEPPEYVRMDDPNYAIARREDLDQFRKVKFGRHKSYAYGEGSSKSAMVSAVVPMTSASQPQVSQPQSKRNTAPVSGPAQVFAAANIARGRRTGLLTTLQEDAGNITTEADDTDTDIGDSPCPPPNKTSLLKGKKIARVSLSRVETYGPSRMALGC
ncbi:hypothetical protein NP233_g5424 [Leucocoprinus birnbaumii]|uniref:M-phase inducer phosphatase n=1 Tax=Leucocoprinus birnbaumii TaxID=56174 RepID=A0AAD5YWS0_9AGAR|nr:hypothetical protein NP233_g5424 [Leucocoprinus birnbaumii]